MLNIFFGDMPEAIYNTEVYFINVYDDDWITDDFAREVIKKVDKSEVLDNQAIKSPVLGIISPERLSGGTKTLLLMKNIPEVRSNHFLRSKNHQMFLCHQQNFVLIGGNNSNTTYKFYCSLHEPKKKKALGSSNNEMEQSQKDKKSQYKSAGASFKCQAYLEFKKNN